MCADRQGKIITFYSYKGGTGRSMAVANVGWILASRGQRVLTIDWDLEAPGLHRYFQPFLLDQELRASPGIIDLVWDYTAAVMDLSRDDDDPLKTYRQIRRYATSIDFDFPDPGILDFVPAGQQDAGYAQRITSFDWRRFYERHGGGALIDALREQTTADYDYVLIDSRTGLADSVGICTVHLPDILVNCMTLSGQNIDGGFAVAQSAVNQRAARPLRIMPVLMRVEDAETSKAEAGRDYVRRRFDPMLSWLSADERDRYWGEVEVPYKPFYAYEEILATVGDRAKQEGTLLAALERVTTRISDGAVSAVGPMDEERRRRLLASFERRLFAADEICIVAAREDFAWREWISWVLSSEGYHVSMAEDRLRVGGDIAIELTSLLSSAAAVIVIVSPALANSSGWRQITDAIARRDPGGTQRLMIPVNVSEAQTDLLDTRLGVDLTGLSADEAQDALTNMVQQLQVPRTADKVPTQTRPWYPGEGITRLILRVAADRCIVLGPAGEERTRGAVTGGNKRLQTELRELRRARREAATAFTATEQQREMSADRLTAAIQRVGVALGQCYVPESPADVLRELIAARAASNEIVLVGIETTGELNDLPWESLILPGEKLPLALHRNVALYRHLGGPGSFPGKVKGPLRVLVAIASPELGGAELLDYEAELNRIVTALEPARKRGQAYVRVLNEGSLEAINTALSEDPDGFHVLHLSCHAQLGELILETADGQPDLVSAERLLADGTPSGSHLPMIVLSGNSTGLDMRQGRLTVRAAERVQGLPDQLTADEEPPDEVALGNLASRLVKAGVPQVLAMQAPITNTYATRLSGEFYRRLASDASPDPTLALAEARRAVERDSEALPPGSQQRGLAEWATPALFAWGLRMPLFNRREPFGPVHLPQAPVLAEGVIVREVGDFVGRRAELRQARRVLSGTKAGLVLHGIGGVGKSTLAVEVLRSLGGDADLVVSKAGQISVDDVLGEVGARLHLAASAAEGGEARARAASYLRAADVEWADRWRLLAEQILPGLPMTVLLDNFEDNLREADDGGWQVRDPELAAFLAGWARRPGQSKLVFTSRYPFALPGSAERRLADLHLGPLSAAETRKLMWRLPGLEALSVEERDRVYRNVGGHPRTLEYLDALLRGGQARFDDIAERIEDRLRDRGITDPAAWLARPGRDLDASLAEAITLSIDDIVLASLLDRLAATPLATELVTGASVYRIPVDDTALTFQVGQAAERSPDSDRTARIRRVQQAIKEAVERADGNQISLEDTWLTAEEYARYQADLTEERQPPVEAPDGLAAAVAAARAGGLLVPVPAGDEPALHFVHRWTAGAIAALHPDAAAEAHRRAAGFWYWRVDTIPQSRQDDIDQLLEARYHHHAAGQTDQAVAATWQVVYQLQTWGQYGRAAELCRETLTWLPSGSQEARFEGQLGVLAQLRGDYDTAERSYRQSLEIFERMGGEAGMAASYHQLGTLAQARGDYDAAEPLYHRSLEIKERIGDQASMAASYHQLGTLAQARGDYDAAEPLYHRSLEIKERIGDQASMAASYHQLGMLAQARGDYDAAEPLYRRSLEIDERIGDQAGMAASYHLLGMLAQARGDYDAAEPLYRRSLEIRERIGDQAGMAASYHLLGMLAQARGDYDAAEPLYRRSLEIRERIGDQASMAASYHQLGTLAQARRDYDAAEPLYRRSLEIRERIGDQEGMAASYHQLGTLAQARRDYDAAEPLYRRSLEIRERIGNREGIATSYAVLGGLSEAAGNLDQAVAYRVGALAIRLQIGTATAGDVQSLADLRRRLDRDRFRSAALASGLDEESAGSLMEMLDQQQGETAGN